MHDKALINQAEQLGACPLLTGAENYHELLKLFLTPQGIEFCTKNNFPNMDQIRSFKSKEAEDMGIYIDCGSIFLKNREQIVIIGDTMATLHYDGPARRYNIVIMNKAEADISAKDYAVVFVNNASGRIINIETKDNAIIL